MAYYGNQPTVGQNQSFKVLDDISSYTETFDGTSTAVVSAANDTLTFYDHRFVQGQRVTYTHGGGAVINGLATATAYYVIRQDKDTIQLAINATNAANGTAIGLSLSGTSGTAHTLNIAFDGTNTKFKATYQTGYHVKLTRAAQLQIAINGVVQEPVDSTSPSNGFGIDSNNVIVFSAAPVSTDDFWGTFLASNLPSWEISDNKVDNFDGNSTATNFTLSKLPANNENVLVTINGVVQHPSDATTTRAYKLIGQEIVFTDAPLTGEAIQVRHIGFAGAAAGGVTGFYGRTGNVTLTSADDVTINNITGVAATFTGNVSIGGTLTYTDVTNIDAVGIITAQQGIHIGAGATAGAIDVTTGIATFSSVGIADSIYHIGDGDTSLRFGTDTFSVETAGSERLRIASDGKVGIGTVTPESGHLQVVGGGYHAINITGNKTANANKISGISFLNYEGNRTSAFQTLTNNSANTIYYGSADSSARGVQNHIFYVNTDRTATSGHSEALRIDSSGNVGVDNSNPSAYGKFVVTGTANIISLNASSGAGSLSFFEGGTGRFYLKTLNGSKGLSFVDGDNSTERLRITSAGEIQAQREYDAVGINTFARFARKGNGGVHVEIGYNAVTLDYGYFGTGTAHGLGLRTNDTTALFIDTSQRLLVGGQTATVDTSTYNSKIQVMADDAEASITVGRFGDNASATALNFSKSRNATIGSHTDGELHDNDVIGNIFWWGSDGGDYEEVARIGAETEALFTGSSTPGALTFHTTAVDATTATERLRIDSSGVVRIQKTGTNAKLLLSRNESVGTDNTETGVIDFANNTGHTTNSRIQGVTDGTGNVGGQLLVETRNPANSTLGERLRITGSGRVGINSTVPTAPLNVQAETSTGTCLRLNQEPTYKKSYIQFQDYATTGVDSYILNEGYDLTVYGGYGGKLNLGAYDKTGITVLSTGLVGVGTDNPGEKLDVDGSLKLRASGNWTTYATRLTSRLDSTHMMSLEAYHNSSSPVEVLGTYADGGGANMRVVLAANGMKVGIGSEAPRGSIDVWGDGSAYPTLRLGTEVYQTEGEDIRFGRTDIGASDIRYHSITSYHDGVSGSANYIKFKVHDAGGDPFTSQKTALTLLGTGTVHIGPSAPTTSDAGADDLVIGNTTDGLNNGMTIWSHTSQNGNIGFADNDANFRGAIQYLHADDALRFLATGEEKFRITEFGTYNTPTTVGDSVNTKQAGRFYTVSGATPLDGDYDDDTWTPLMRCGHSFNGTLRLWMAFNGDEFQNGCRQKTIDCQGTYGYIDLEEESAFNQNALGAGLNSFDMAYQNTGSPNYYFKVKGTWASGQNTPIILWSWIGHNSEYPYAL